MEKIQQTKTTTSTNRNSSNILILAGSIVKIALLPAQDIKGSDKTRPGYRSSYLNKKQENSFP